MNSFMYYRIISFRTIFQSSFISKRILWYFVLHQLVHPNKRLHLNLINAGHGGQEAGN